MKICKCKKTLAALKKKALKFVGYIANLSLHTILFSLKRLLLKDGLLEFTL